MNDNNDKILEQLQKLEAESVVKVPERPMPIRKSRLRMGIRQLLAANSMARKIPDPEIVKFLLPRTSFTKKLTPGRIRDLREALASLTPEQLEIARARGWDRGVY